eukprot:1176901-Prorocentrum_minimum.AAC.2
MQSARSLLLFGKKDRSVRKKRTACSAVSPPSAGAFTAAPAASWRSTPATSAARAAATSAAGPPSPTAAAASARLTNLRPTRERSFSFRIGRGPVHRVGHIHLKHVPNSRAPLP